MRVFEEIRKIRKGRIGKIEIKLNDLTRSIERMGL